MLASIIRSNNYYSLRVTIAQEEAIYLSSHIQGSEPKLNFEGTLKEGLLLWFAPRGQVSLRRRLDAKDPSLEAFVNVRQIGGKDELTPRVTVAVERCTTVDNIPALRMSPMPEWAEAPFNPAMAKLAEAPPQQGLVKVDSPPDDQAIRDRKQRMAAAIARFRSTMGGSPLTPPSPIFQPAPAPESTLDEEEETEVQPASPPPRTPRIIEIKPATLASVPAPAPVRAAAPEPQEDGEDEEEEEEEEEEEADVAAPVAPKVESIAPTAPAQPPTTADLAPAAVSSRSTLSSVPMPDDVVSELKLAIEMVNAVLARTDPKSIIVRVEENQIVAKRLRVTEEEV